MTPQAMLVKSDFFVARLVRILVAMRVLNGDLEFFMGCINLYLRLLLYVPAALVAKRSPPLGNSGC